MIGHPSRYPRRRRQRTGSGRPLAARRGFRSALIVERLEDRLCLSAFYDFDLVAHTGAEDLGGFSEIGAFDLNDRGQVAFHGSRPGDNPRRDEIYVGVGFDSLDGKPEPAANLMQGATFRWESSEFGHEGDELIGINNFGQVAAFHRGDFGEAENDPNPDEWAEASWPLSAADVRVWDTRNPGTSTVVAQGTMPERTEEEPKGTLPAGHFGAILFDRGDCDPEDPTFCSGEGIIPTAGLASFGFNNAEQVGLLALPWGEDKEPINFDEAIWQLYIGQDRTTPQSQSHGPVEGFPPIALADNGTVLLMGQRQIVLAEPNAAGGLDFTTIASEADAAWDTLDFQPAISDDGSVVVFLGDRGNGPGVFASVAVAQNTRQIVRVAGENAAANPHVELGYRFTGDSNGDGVLDQQDIRPVYFDSLSSPWKPQITTFQQPSGASWIEPGERFVVSFYGRPSEAGRDNAVTNDPLLYSAQEGIWTVQVLADPPWSGSGQPVEFHTTSAMPVVQLGDRVTLTEDRFGLGPKISGTVTSLSGMALSKAQPIAPIPPAPGDHYVAFMAGIETSAGGPSIPASQRMLIRAGQIDSDQDGLFDHWERFGIDMDQDGEIDLNLPAMGAEVLHKDLFLEIDWLAPGSGDFSPQSGAIEFLVDMFAGAPVQNPDGVDGINVHVDAGALSRNFPAFPADVRQGGTGISDHGNHIDVIYFDVDGAVSFASHNARSMESIKDSHFGAQSEKMARELSFHYVVFANQHTAPTEQGSGKAELSFVDNARAANSPRIPGNDLVVTLQGFRNAAGLPLKVPPLDSGVTVPAPDAFFHGQTLAHELGHNLGLRHGGVDEVTAMPPATAGAIPAGFKPDYRSLMNYAYQVFPDSTGSLVRDYSGSGDLIFNDWAHIQLDFVRYFDMVGNTYGIETRLGAAGPQPEQPVDEISVRDLAAIHGPFDKEGPSIAVDLSLNETIPLTSNFTVTAQVTDDFSIEAVVIHFDTNGDGVFEHPAERQPATLVAPDTYEATFHNVSGPSGPRNVVVVAVDSSQFTSTVTTAVQVLEGSINDPPVNTLPGNQTAFESVPLVIHGISVTDPDAHEGDGVMQVTLSVQNGTLSVFDGLETGAQVAGSGTREIVLSGIEAAINATFAAGVTYRGDADFSGIETLTVTTNDLGNTGIGGPLTDTDTLAIRVLSVEEQAAHLIQEVRTLVDGGLLNRGQGNALIAKLKIQDNVNGNIGRVSAFKNQLAAFAGAGILAQLQAADLLDLIDALLMSLSTSVEGGASGGEPLSAARLDSIFGDRDLLQALLVPKQKSGGMGVVP